jgi:hypothetical protein
LLGLARERRKREADGENDREPDHPHGHLGMMTGGSLAEDRLGKSRPTLVNQRPRIG